MKNKILKLLLLALVVTTIFSCGAKIEKEEDATSTDQEKTKAKEVDDSIKLLEFQNILDVINKKVKVGDTVKYGVMSYDVEDYERDIVPMMEWEVLDVEDNKALLITKQIILAETFDEVEGANANWANSKIRSECKSSEGYIFSDYEREGILETDTTINGESTKDRIFVLSVEEFLKYYGDNDKEGKNLKAISIATNYVKKKGLDVRKNEDSEYYGAGSYWLRDNATINGNAVWVGEYGHLYREGDKKNIVNGIRFSMWVDVNHLTYEKRIKFGTFEQDANEENGEEAIDWYVLEIKNNKLCLLAKNILFNMQFDEEEKGKKYKYSESKIRKMLTKDFYENSFSKKEKDMFLDINYKTAFEKHIEDTYDDYEKEFSDKIIILSTKEFKRYIGHDEGYAPPDSIRYETKLTKYAETSPESAYIEDKRNIGYVKNTHIDYWLRDISYDPGYVEYVAYIRNDRNFVIAANVSSSYGVRPYIELDLNKMKEICDNNIDQIKKLQEETKKPKENNKEVSNAKYENDDNIMLGTKNIKILAYFYDMLEKKYNVNVDINHYDIDEKNNEILLFLKANESKYNKYEGMVKFKYDLTEKGFPQNEKIIDKYDMVSVEGIKSSEKNNLIITERNFAITLLKLLNPSHIKPYERLALKKSIVDKYPNYRTEGLLLNDENIAKTDNEYDIFTVFSTYGTYKKHSETGYEKLEIENGLNEYEIDVACYDKIVKYKLKVDVKFIDEENFYIDDINYEYIKTINKPSGYKKPKYFLDEVYITNVFSLYGDLKKVLLEKQKDEKVQKKITTYEELVAKAKNEKIKAESSEYGGDLDSMDSAVNDWFYDDRERQSGIIDAGDGLKLETVKFGKYPQTKDGKKKDDIEWYVLANSDGKKLLISKYILDNKRFTDNNLLATWEDSTLRDWLNGEFYNTAFNDNEKKKIIETEIKCTANEEEYDIFTKDKVFLLSFEEYEKYFKGMPNAHVNPYGSTFATEYARNVKNGSKTLAIEEKSSYWSEAYAEGNSCYWLRDRRKSILNDPSDQVINVTGIGQVLSEEFFNRENAGVRPVILISDSKNNNSKNKEDNKKSENSDTNNQEVKGSLYKFLLKLGNKDLYIDVYTNIFTLENEERVNIGKLINVYPAYELNELDEYTKNYYYFDKKNELLYFKDLSEMYLYNEGHGEEYTSLCMIDKFLNKTKLGEKVKSYCVLNDEVLIRYEKKYDIYKYKDGEESKLDLGEYWFNLKGNNGDDKCYIYKVNKDKTEEWYLYKDSKVTKTTKPKE